MRMLFNIVVICIATWIVTAEANIGAVTVAKPTPTTVQPVCKPVPSGVIILS